MIWQGLTVALLLAAILFTFSWQDGYVVLFLTIFLGALLALTIARLILVGKAQIMLERDNFEIRTPMTQTSFARNKARDFRVRDFMGTKWVEFTYSGDAADIGFGESMSPQTGDNQFKIDNYYEYPPEELAAILAEYCAQPEGADVPEEEDIAEEPHEPRPV